LQQYLDTHNDTISEDLRLTWCFQAAEAITYIHSKAIIHSDLRPENLLHHTREDESTPELLLCDFGGSYCKIGDKVIDGGHLPDTGFFNPNSKWVSDRDTDIFALGSVFYTVMTGHWPYKSPGPFVDVEEWDEYDEKVNELFMNREFPPVGNLVGGDITLDCWTETIRDAWGGCSSLRGFAATGEVGEGRKEEEVAELAPNPIDLRQKTYHISSLLSVMAKLELRSTVSVAERSLLVMLAIVWLS
jgi:serine/threonine protein kinase